jgi:hypothetical protein
VAIGIDWVALGILLAAYAFAQVRAVPVRLRYATFAVAAAAVAAWKLSGGALAAGAAGPNRILVFVAGGLAVWYMVKAFRAPPSH